MVSHSIAIFEAQRCLLAGTLSGATIVYVVPCSGIAPSRRATKRMSQQKGQQLAWNNIACHDNTDRCKGVLECHPYQTAASVAPSLEN
jgi:hypothetical protein